jgi:hypothetical protein
MHYRRLVYHLLLCLLYLWLLMLLLVVLLEHLLLLLHELGLWLLIDELIGISILSLS